MFIYTIHKAYNDNYFNHCMLRELFPGEIYILYQRNGSKLFVLSNNLVDSKYKDDLFIEYKGDIGQYLLGLDEQILFNIRLNGAKTSNYKRVRLSQEEISSWVDNKLSNIGIEVMQRNIIDEGIITSERKGSKCYHASLYVNGIMKITDMELFTNALCKGIGHGKCFGFGLLNIFNFN